MTTLYDFTVSNQADQLVSLHDYKGKVVLIVNTATGCGLTHSIRACRNSMINTKTKDSRFLIFLVISLWDRHLVVLKKSIPSAPSIIIQPSLGLPKSRSMVRKQSHFLIG